LAKSAARCHIGWRTAGDGERLYRRAVGPRIVGIVAILAVVALYCYYTAKRLDRLHRRMDAAGAALDAQLRRRAAASRTFARSGELPRDLSDDLTTAVEAVLARSQLDHDREVVENALSRVLAEIAEHHREVFLSPSPIASDVHDEALRATIARRFYNDTVRNTLVVRDRRAIRWLGLAGHAAHPTYFEMDDEELPAPKISVASQA
jgi:hypothetical protein